MIVAESVRYRHPGAADAALADISLNLRPGELTVVTGRTGSGKSTLLRRLAGLLPRHGSGDHDGAVKLSDGDDPAALPPAVRVRRIGFVGQDPSRQLLADTVADELRFGPLSAGLGPGAVDVGVALARAGLGDIAADRSPRTLSGGQQQRLLVAAGLAAGAGVLLLDEPLAHLDPEGAGALIALLRQLADEGRTVAIVEHRLDPLLLRADRAAVMQRGALAWEGTAEQTPLPLLRSLGLMAPGLPDLADRLDARGLDLATARFEPGRAAAPKAGPRRLTLPTTSWRRGGRLALDAVGLELREGERVAVIGHNGAGKSSLIAALAGAVRGVRRTASGRVIDVPQDPDLALFAETVRDELAHGPVEGGAHDVEAQVARWAAALSIGELLPRPPQGLSRGQRLRVAVAAALAADPHVLLLDEPTAGQDRAELERMFDVLEEHGRTVLFATHDIDLALRRATHVVRMESGRVIERGNPADVARRLPRALLPSLAQFCIDRGLPVSTALDLAERAR